ncbi:DUF362 domain-containing protein [Candidatus Poribacteria bacterium]|nr:DUF362 domain-containing protein [Candidatus Poribacteria bacterium]
MENKITHKSKISRRTFLRRTSTGAIGVAIGAGAIGSQFEQAFGQIRQPKVVEVRSDNVWKDNPLTPFGKGEGEALNVEIVRSMMAKGMQSLTRRDKVEDAWKEFVVSDDVVGIKINPLSGPVLSTHRAVVDEIIAGLISAGVPENNIIVWDRFEEHLKRAGYEINVGETGVRYYATDGQGPGYDKKVFYETDEDAKNRRDENGMRSFFSKIVTEQVTKIINVPVLKQHAVAGTSLSLKNLAFGSVNNTTRFHPNPINCNPMIADICAVSAIKNKLVLNIIDGLLGCFDGGPGYKPEGIWQYNSLLFSADPVAIDRVGIEIIDTKRKEEKLESMTSLAKYISTAWRLGLGTNNLDEIDREKLTV